MSEKTPAKKKSTQVSALVGCLVMMLVIFLVLPLLAGFTVLWEIPVRLLVGWVFFLSDNLSVLEVNWEMTACGTGALMLATFGLHRCMIWLRGSKPWKWRCTISVTAMMLALFAASVAMTGIIHQLAWMTREPLTQSNRRTRITENTNNLKQLFYLLVEYDADYGEYPPSLDHLVAKDYIKPEMMREFLFRPSRGKTPEPWIYLGAGTGTDMGAEGEKIPLIVAPHAIRDRWVVLLRDGAVKQETTKTMKEKYPVLHEQLPYLFQQE